MLPAISNVMPDESTECDEPSVNITDTSTTGYQATTPSTAALRMPFSTAGMKSFGTLPPTTFDPNVIPLPVSPAEISSTTWPY
jgi:hypothetical protein